MKIRLSLGFILFLILLSACSRSASVNGAGAPVARSGETVTVNTDARPDNTPAQTVENQPSLTPANRVRFDGENFIKKNGWLVPSRNDIYADPEDTDRRPLEAKTRSGKAVKVASINYIYQVPWIHSEEFLFDGKNLNYLKGRLESDHFVEMRVKGKVFMYYIFVHKVTGLPANAEPHEDPFMYWIEDRDGDGIFETLVSVDFDNDIIVPNWVLRDRRRK